MKVDDGWDSAYDGDFTQGANHGTYPLVVSYASSPPAAVYYSKPQPTTSPVGTMLDSCFRQVEFVGVLQGHGARRRGTQARRLHALARRSRPTCRCRCSCSRSATGTPLPAVFAKFAEVAPQPLTLPAAEIGAHRDAVDRAVDRHRAAVMHARAATRGRGLRSRSCRSRSSAVFFVYPVAAIVGRGLAPGGDVDLEPLGDVVTDAALRHVAWFTVWQATLSTVLTVLVGAARARTCSPRYEFPGRGWCARW